MMRASRALLAAIAGSTLMAASACSEKPTNDAGGNGGGTTSPETGGTSGAVAAPPAAAPAAASTSIGEAAAGFAAFCREKAASAEAFNVAGADERWLFLATELAHLGEGAFWESSDGPDPVEIIRDYAEALEAMNVGLLVVPVPPKAAIYPEKVSPDVRLVEGRPAPDAVIPAAGFFARLEAAGVEAIDLEPVFREHRATHPEESLYCEQDAHWSPRGAEVAAEVVAKAVEASGGLSSAPREAFLVGEPEPLAIKGDLVDGAFADLPRETVAIRRAGKPGAGGIEPVDEDEGSPLLLLGDSHLLVFTVGGAEFHCKAAGFRDHLQARLGLAADVAANRAGGADSARINLAMRAKKDAAFWEGKRTLVWLFSAREFTQGKWRKIPPKP